MKVRVLAQHSNSAIHSRPDMADEVFRGTGLMQKGHIQAGILLFRLSHSADDNDRNAIADPPQAADESVAADPGHNMVSNDNPEAVSSLRVLQHTESFLRGVGGRDREASLAQHRLAHVQLRRTVINKQDLRQWSPRVRA